MSTLRASETSLMSRSPGMGIRAKMWWGGEGQPAGAPGAKYRKFWEGKYGQAGRRGAGAAFGLEKTASRTVTNSFGQQQTVGGKMKFMGGRPGGFIGAGAGLALWAATGDPMMGLAGAVGTTAAIAKSARFGISGGVGGALMKGAMPWMTGMAIYEGYKHGGITGAAGAAASQAAGFAVFDMLATTPVGKLLMNPIALGAAALGYGAYKGVQALAELGKSTKRSEFIGDTAAFSTQGAWTMRSRALQEINRSHTNSRTILGQEAQLYHM